MGDVKTEVEEYKERERVAYLENQLATLQAEKERLEGELGRLEQELIDGVIGLITTEQKAMCNLYQKHTYGINKVCNRLKIFVGDLIKPTQEPTNGS